MMYEKTIKRITDDPFNISLGITITLILLTVLYARKDAVYTLLCYLKIDSVFKLIWNPFCTVVIMVPYLTYWCGFTA